ncbi:hypothetical protein [Fibrobacter sp. HC4]|uniref:hypothetical protein n=1 Tax=Fibrobacter sp. HC4 TaxID=3239812 RepID=UPI0020186932|nr:hypothetical protein [Fibrobacter succinogenes]MCL4101707.1 hypothetical protein [Fibrobacter succinogenes]
MLLKKYSHRNAETIFKKTEKYSSLYREVLTAIDSIQDEDLIQNFKNSLSESIFELLKERLTSLQWNTDCPIFKDEAYKGDAWRPSLIMSKRPYKLLRDSASCPHVQSIANTVADYWFGSPENLYCRSPNEIHQKTLAQL